MSDRDHCARCGRPFTATQQSKRVLNPDPNAGPMYVAVCRAERMCEVRRLQHQGTGKVTAIMVSGKTEPDGTEPGEPENNGGYQPILSVAVREMLGRAVRDAWVAYCLEIGDLKPSHVALWNALSEQDQEADRRIGEAAVLAYRTWQLLHAAPAPAPSPREAHLAEVAEEMELAQATHGNFASDHEAYAVLLEECDEVWAEVKRSEQFRRLTDLRRELIQVAAVATRWAVQLTERLTRGRRADAANNS